MARTRKARLRRMTLESLESRTLLATSNLPSPNVLGRTDVSGAQSSTAGNQSNPSITVDPLDPLRVVSVWQNFDPALPAATPVVVEGAYSTDGGQTWHALSLPAVLSDPLQGPPGPLNQFSNTTDASVAFDRAHNFYVVDSEHSSQMLSGAIVLQKYNFANTAIPPVQTITNQIVHEWMATGSGSGITGDMAFTPSLAVDSNVGNPATSLPTSSAGSAGTPAGIAVGPDSNLYVAQGNLDQVQQYNGSTGLYQSVFASGEGIFQPNDLTFNPVDGNLFITNERTGDVVQVSGATGLPLGVFTAPQGLPKAPGDMVLGPDGDLYVASRDSNAVLRYNTTTGAFLGTFIQPGEGGLSGPEGLTFGPDGFLYVSSSNTGQILRYNGTTGVFQDIFVDTKVGLLQPEGLTFGPDGNLYVADFKANLVDRFDHTTGNLIGVFTQGTAPIGPTSITFGPVDGDLYVASTGQDQVLRYDGSKGTFLSAFLAPPLGGLTAPEGLAFLKVGSRYELFVGSSGTDSVLEFDAQTGRFVTAFVPAGSGGLSGPAGLVFTPDASLLVSSRNTNQILHYQGGTGNFLQSITPQPVNAPQDSVLGPDGVLYVSSRNTDTVDRYDPTTGQFLGVFVASGSGGLNLPEGLAFGSDGNLYVGSAFQNAILEYSGQTGAFIGVFVSPSNNQGLKDPTDLAFRNGLLFVSSAGTDEVMTFSASTGAPAGIFTPAPLAAPEGSTIGPDGNLYVASRDGNEVIEYNGTTGAFIRVFVTAKSGGLTQPRGVAFYKGNLFVSSFKTNQVLEYNGTTGSFLGIFTPEDLNAPEDAVVSPDGKTLYVTSSASNEVLAFDNTTGAFKSIFVPAGSGGLTAPEGLVFGKDGNLYVSSSGTGQILEYSGTTGAFINVFVAAGGLLGIPAGLTVDSAGNFYVSDDSTDSVLKYTPAGAGSQFIAPGRGGLNGPQDLTFTPDGTTLMVASFYSSQVLAYSAANGAFIGNVGVKGVSGPHGLIFDGSGNLYVSNELTSNIVVYNLASKATNTLVPGPSGGIDVPDGLAFASDGSLLVVNRGTNEILRYNTGTGAWLGAFTPEPLVNPTGLSFDAAKGYLYVSSYGSNQVIKYNANTGAYIGIQTPEPLLTPEDIVMRSGDTSIYAASAASNEILRYDPTGNLIGPFVVKGAGGLDYPESMAFNPNNGNLEVVSAGTGQILEYSGTTGAFVRVFVATGSGTMATPEDIVFGPDGNLYVTDKATNDVLRFDGKSGAPLPGGANPANPGAQFILPGANSLLAPTGIAFDSAGNIYVASSGNNQVDKFSAQGTNGSTYVASGNGLSNPDRIALDQNTNLYVTSFGSNSVLLYDNTGKFKSAFVPSGLGGLSGPSGLVLAGLSSAGFNPLYVASQNNNKILSYSPGANNTATFNGQVSPESLVQPEGLILVANNGLDVSSSGTNEILGYSTLQTPSPGNGVVAGANTGLNDPTYMVIGPDKLLYVSSLATNSVLRYDPTNGSLVGVFVPPGEGGLVAPEGLTFLPNGDLLVSSRDSAEVLEYDPNGVFVGPFTPEPLLSPGGLTFGPTGNLYVTTQGGNAVFNFDGTTGNFLSHFTLDNLVNPDGAVTDAAGNLYVASRDKNSILKYDATTGAFVSRFVTQGSGGLSQPGTMTFGPDGNLYVISAGTNQILRYSGSTGQYLGVFVDAGSGGLQKPVGLAYGPDGNLYVTDAGTGTVREYRKGSGFFIKTFVAAGSLTSPAGLAFGPDGNLYVVDTAANDVLQFNGTSGALMSTFVAAGSGGLAGPRDLLFGADGSLYVDSPSQNEVLRYSGTTGAFIDIFIQSGRGGLSTPAGLVTAANGNLLVVSQDTGQVLEYDSTLGTLVAPFTPGPLLSPQHLTFDAAGNLYVTSTTNNGVLEYNSAGLLQKDFVPFGSGGLSAPSGIVFGPAGNLIVSSSGGNNLLSYNGANGAYLQAFNPDTPQAPTYSTIGPDGLLYVSSRDTNSVVRYDPKTGKLLGTFVQPGAGGLNEPTGLAFGPDGNLYVASEGTDEVLRYNGVTGVLIDKMVLAGLGGLSLPQQITFGPDGNLYVASFGDDAVYRYRGTTGAFLNAFVTPGSGKLSGPTGLAFSADGKTLYVSSYNNDAVLSYGGSSGLFLGAFVANYANGLSGPLALAVQGGSLYVASDAADASFLNAQIATNSDRDNRVLQYSLATGAFQGAIVTRGSGGLAGPTGIAFANGNLYVSSRDSNQVLEYNAAGTFVASLNNIPQLRGITFGPDANGDSVPDLYAADHADGSINIYDGKTGEFVNYFVEPRVGGLWAPASITFGPGGDLYVSNIDRNGNSEILRFTAAGVPAPAAGQNGAVFATNAQLVNPQGLAFGPDGDLYVISQGTSEVLRFDTSGNFLGSFISTGLKTPAGLAFNADGTLDVSDAGLGQVLRFDRTGKPLGLAAKPQSPGFTDPATGVIQNDPYSGNVYVAWATNVLTSDSLNANLTANAIVMTTSSDGGNTFTPPSVVNNSGFSSPIEADAQPKLTISQGRPAGTNGPTDKGVPAGQVTVVWDDFGSNNFYGTSVPPFDTINANSVQGGTSASFTNTILDAKNNVLSAVLDPPTGAPTTTSFTLPVNISDPRFTTLSHIDVRLDLVSPDLSQLEIDLIGPNGLRVPLVGNPLVNPRLTGLTGVDLGGPDGYDLSTIFDQTAPASILDPLYKAPYVGRFRPDTDPGDPNATPVIPPGPDLNSFNGLPLSAINGSWTLQITDFSEAGLPFPTQYLKDWGLDISSGTTAGTQSLVAQTYATGGLTGTLFKNIKPTGIYGESPKAKTTFGDQTGFGPAPDIASDNTLGSFSPYEGRMYATYVSLPNPFVSAYTDGTSIALLYSDDGGQTWSTPEQVNDDNALTDGNSESYQALTSGLTRPHYQPQIAVDPSTGQVALSFYDARNDSARARVATYVAVSNDGAQSFAPESFVNSPNKVTDAITGQSVILGPIPDNQSPIVPGDPYQGNPNSETTYGYGDHQGLAFVDGHLYPAWSGNENGGPLGQNMLNIRVAQVTTSSGPRVLSSTEGPVQAQTVVDTTGVSRTFNNLNQADGTPIANGFLVTFDRAVDPTSLGPQDITVNYRDVSTSGFQPGIGMIVGPVYPLLQGSTRQGPTEFLVYFSAPKSTLVGAGTYSYAVDPEVRDRIRTVGATGSVQTGNLMDQNQDGKGGEDPRTAPITGLTPGDVYAVPTPAPTTPVTFSGSTYQPPYAVTSMPLLVTGPRVIGSYVPGVAATPDNLVTDASVSQLAVVFDRDMDPSTISGSSVVSVMGPAGLIAGPFTMIHDPAETGGTMRRFLVGFPASLVLSGTYTVTLASSIRSASGSLLDTNQNAGLDILRGNPAAGTLPVVYTSNDPSPPVIGSAPGSVAVSTINVPDNFVIQEGVTVTINVTYPNDPDLVGYLIAPDGTSIELFQNVGNTGTHANFVDTTFDDTAKTPIENGGPPFSSALHYDPRFPLSVLSQTNTSPGHDSQGVWKLEIVNVAGGHVGTIGKWQLQLVRPVSGTGLGEAVADQATVSFRIFTMDPTNPLSSNEWTAVGPAGIGAKAGTLNGEISGRIGAIAVDPSDPSGNTVYVSGASGGVWKTTDFLTTSPDGPTYIPLTDFGPTLGLNVSSIAVFGRNNDPSQSIIIAGTGDPDALGQELPGTPARGDSPSLTARGLGFLISYDGGATWSLLDSSSNYDSSGNLLAVNSPLRDHVFLNSAVSKVVVDPRLTPDGQVIIYAALLDVTADGHQGSTGPAGGIWRSVDTGKTWQRMRPGEASDVLLDQNSGTGVQGGNLQIIYGAFMGQGVYSSPDRGQTWNLMAGTTGDPLIQDFDFTPTSAVGVGSVNGAYSAGDTPNGPKARIILAKPALTGNPLEDILYEGWLYAAVISTPTIVTADNQLVQGGHLDGLFVTKDFGQNWTRIQDPYLGDDQNGVKIPSTDPREGNFEPTGGETPYGEAPDLVDPANPDLDNLGQGNFDISLVVDPSNPNVIYVGGTDQNHYSGLVRVDTTGIADPHAFYMGQGDPQGKLPGEPVTADATGGSLGVYDNDPTKTPDWSAVQLLSPTYPVSAQPPGTFNPVTTPYLNLIANPLDPFLQGSTIPVANTSAFENTGIDTKWISLEQALQPSTFDTNSNDPWSLPTTGIHRMIAETDPLTGKTRLIFGDDNGVYTAVIAPDGTLVGSVGDVTHLNTAAGDVTVPSGSRNGNLQIAQFYYGTAQPSNLAAQASVLQGMFYGSSQFNSTPNSNPNVIQQGATGYGSIDWSRPGTIRGTGGGIAAVQNGPGQPDFGTVYRIETPQTVDNGVSTDFFQHDLTSRTFGLLQNTAGQLDPATGFALGDVPDGQWPYRMAFNFAVNPLDGDQAIISSLDGRVFGTETAGKFWNVIAVPSSLDGTNAQALVYGAPDPNAPGGTGNLDNYLLAGTIGGNLFVTFTGGGAQGNQWTNLSGGLDGSPVQQIVTDPTPGSHRAYAVTEKAVYYIADTSAKGANWLPITGNLFGIEEPLFGNSAQLAIRPRDLTSIVADWRYLIPDDPANPNGPTHPMLYVGGEGGVFRSTDNGSTWILFPSLDPNALNPTAAAAYGDGGGLPNALVTSLNLSIGQINPTNGRADISTGPNVLLASTFGRGDFTIRLAPDVFASSLGLDPNLPAPGGSDSSPTHTGITNVVQPYIDGLSEQTAFGQVVTVNMYDETNATSPVLIGTGTTDSTGRFSIQVIAGHFKSDGSTDGLKTIGIQAVDQAGTRGNIATFQFTLLTKAPTNNSPPVLEASSDSGFSNTDDITNVVDPTFDITGTGVAASYTVELVRKLDGSPNTSYVLVGTRVGPGSIQDPGPLGQGVYDYASVLIDLAGNASAYSTPLVVTIQTQAPPAPSSLVLDPASDSGIKGDNVTNVTKPFIDVSGGVAATSEIEMYRNGSLVATRFGPGSLQDPGPLTDGSYVFTAQQVDVAGNLGPISLPLTITIKTSARALPAPTLDSKSDSGVQGDNITNVTKPTMDASQAETGATVTLFRDGKAVGSRAGSGGIQDPGPLTDGAYSYTVQETDIAGNVSAMSPATSITILATPPAAPSVPVLDPASDSGTKGDNITNFTSPTFDINTAVATATVELFRNGSFVASRTGPGTIQDPGPAQPDGKYTYTALQIDVAGNTSVASAGLVVTILTQAPLAPPAPVLEAKSDSGAPGYTNVNNPYFDVTASATTDTVQLVRKLASAPATAYVVVSSRLGTGAVQDPGPAPDGEYTYAAAQVDVAGNLGPIGPATTVTIITTPPPAPSVPVLDVKSDSGVTGDNITNFTKPTFDITTAQATATVDLFRNGKLVGSRTGPGAILDPGPVQPDGVYQYTAQQIDLANNLSPLSAALAVTIDTTPPAAGPAPVLDAASDSSHGKDITNFTSPVFDVTATETTATVQLLRKPSSSPASAYVVVGSTLGSGKITDVGPVPDGTYSYATEQVDVAGNLGAIGTAITVTILSTAPPAPPTPVLDPASDSSHGLDITNVTSPKIDLTASNATLTVALYRKLDSAPVGTYVLIGTTTGTGSVIDKGPLAAGAYDYVAQQTDVAGNTGSQSAKLVVTIITSAPALSAPVLEAASDSGVVGDDITNVTSPTFDISPAEGGAKVELLRNGAVVASLTTVNGGTVALKDPGPVKPDGVYKYTAIQVDQAGNSSPASPATSVTIKTTAATPGTPVLDPASDSGKKGDNITNVVKPSFDISGGEANASVELLRNGKVVNTATTTAAGTVIIPDPGPLASGQYTYTAQQIDVAGNTSALSGAVTVTIMATTPPEPSTPALDKNLPAPGGSDSGFSNTDDITNVTKPYLDVNGIVPGATVFLYRNGVQVASLTSASSGNVVIQDLGPLTNGTYSYTASQTDAAGNVSPISAALNVTIVTGPVTFVPGTPHLQAGSDSGPSNSDDITNVTAPYFDEAPVQFGVTVELIRDGTVVNTRSGPGAIQDPGILSDGMHTYQAREVDIAGNVGPLSGSVIVTVLTKVTTPGTPVLDPRSDSGVKGDDITKVTNPYVDVSGIEAKATVQLLRNGIVVASLTSAAGGNVVIQDPGPLVNGNYTYTVKQTDLAGNVSAASGSLTVTILAAATASPGTPAIQLASDSGAPTYPNYTKVTSPIFDISGALAGDTVQLLRDGAAVASKAVNASGTISLQDLGPVAVGTHSYRAWQLDVAGNISPVSGSFILTIETAAATPGAPALDASTDSGVKGDGITNFKNPLFGIHGAEAKATVRLYRDGVEVAHVVSTAGGSLQLQDPGPVPDGVHTYKTQQTDPAGNVSAMSAPTSVTILTVAPAVPTLGLAPGSDSGKQGDGITNVTQPFLAGATSPNVNVTLIDGTGNPGPSTTTDSKGQFTVQVPTTLADGTYTFTVQATDVAGNSSSSQPFTFTITTASPTAPTIALAPADDSSHGLFVTNVKQPHFTGTADKGITINLIDAHGNVLGTTMASATDGTFTVQPSSPLADGVYSLMTQAVDVAGNKTASTALALTIDTVGPAPISLTLAPINNAFYTGVLATHSLQPFLTGITEKGVLVQLFNSAKQMIGSTVSRTTDGVFAIQPSSPLTAGPIGLYVVATDVAGNVGYTGPTTSLFVSPTAGDYDADTKADLPTFHPQTSAYWTIGESSHSPVVTPFGTTGDVPFIGDVDGDGKADLILYRPSNQTWYIMRSSAGPEGIAFGGPGDIPIVGDFEGNGRTDIGVYRPSNQTWYIQRPTLGNEAIQFGGPNDIPVPGYWDGVGKPMDVAVYRPSTAEWFIQGATGNRYQQFGAPGDIPVPADYNGDGVTDVAVYRAGTAEWFLSESGGGGNHYVQFGQAGDIPVPLDYSGDSKAEVAVYRPSTSQWRVLEPDGATSAQISGLPGEIPVPAPLSYRTRGGLISGGGSGGGGGGAGGGAGLIVVPNLGQQAVALSTGTTADLVKGHRPRHRPVHHKGRPAPRAYVVTQGHTTPGDHVLTAALETLGHSRRGRFHGGS
jgi:DNA-binding beta-propeller fold protein YncE/subtilisin-like proprotein convertase family protein